MDFYILVLLGLIVIFAAGFIQGLTSFGFALISMPLLTLFIPLQEAVPLVVILSLCTNVIVFISTWRFIQIRKIGLLVVSSLLAAPFGTQLLVYVEPHILKLFAGLLIVVFACLLLMGKSFPVKNERVAFIPVGLTSGLLNGSISMSGPPVALFLSNQGASKETFRANITVYGIILNVITVTAFFYRDLLTYDVMKYTVWFVPATFTGVIVGVKALKKLNDKLFRRIALWLIITSGVWTIVSALRII
jgi:uncharacterized membrane protein YfcA